MIKIHTGAMVTIQTFDGIFQTMELPGGETLECWNIVEVSSDHLVKIEYRGFVPDASVAQYVWVHASDILSILSATYRPFLCPKCNNITDPYVCHCGESAKMHDAWSAGHAFVPMGCTCGYHKEEDPADHWTWDEKKREVPTADR